MPHEPRPRARASSTNRGGDLVGAVINVVLLYLLNFRPGWQVVDFLTPETAAVLGIVNATLIVSAVGGLLYAVIGSRAFRALGGVVTSAVALAATIAVWRVFPFDFSAYAFDWALVARILLMLGMVGTAIGIIVSLGMFARAVMSGADRG